MAVAWVETAVTVGAGGAKARARAAGARAVAVAERGIDRTRHGNSSVCK
jgi:hypothetical protein